MVPDKSLTKAVASRWRWMLHCWFLRESVQDAVRMAAECEQSISKERDKSHLLRLEIDELKYRIAKDEEMHQLARDGNRALLRFIHTGHRLNVKFDADSIRSALQRPNGK